MSEKLTRREFLKGFALIAGGTLATGGVIYKIGENERRLQELRDELQKIKEEQEENINGDCINENILRQALGVPTVPLEQCKEERKRWREEMMRLGKESG